MRTFMAPRVSSRRYHKLTGKFFAWHEISRTPVLRPLIAARNSRRASSRTRFRRQTDKQTNRWTAPARKAALKRGGGSLSITAHIISMLLLRSAAAAQRPILTLY